MLNWNQAAPKEAEEAEREQRLVEEALAKREAEEARKAAEEQEQERRKAEEVLPMGTLRKINMEHNHGGLEDHFLSKWVLCRFHVNLPGCREDDGKR